MDIQSCKQLIASADVCGHVPLITGPHGIGKSEINAQYAKEQDLHFECLILSLMDTGDMLGLPITEKVGGMTSTLWAAPTWYTNIVNAAWPEELKLDRIQFVDTSFQDYAIPRLTSGELVDRAQLNKLYCEYYEVPTDRLQLLRQENVNYLDSRRSLLFLDEFNRAPADILNASLQLILDHRLHSHELPIINGQETMIVAAVNPADGSYTVQEFDPALYDRFVVCDAEPDLKSWQEWAKDKEVNKIVRDFLSENQNKFHHTPENGEKGASPRSWTRLAHYIDRLQDKSDTIVTEDMMTHYIKGTVGSSLAAQFIMFYNNYDDAMSAKELEKLIKKEIRKAGKTVDVEKIAEEFSELVSEMDAVRRQEFADTYLSSYVTKTTAKQAMPLLVYLYALPLESLSSVLKTIQSDNPEGYANLAMLDKEANNKGLFLKLISNLKNT